MGILDLINWSKISHEPDLIGYENDDFIKNIPTYIFKEDNKPKKQCFISCSKEYIENRLCECYNEVKKLE